MQQLLWKVTAGSSVVGAFALAVAFFGVDSAPQGAYWAACAVGFAVIPYCLARAAAELGVGKS